MFWEAPTCVVCLTELYNNLSAAPCGHVFHSECIEKCLFSQCKNCPLCRSRVVPSKLVPLSFNLTAKEQPTKVLGLSEEESKNLLTLQNLAVEAQNEKKILEKRLKEAEGMVAGKSESIAALQKIVEDERHNCGKYQKKYEESLKEVSHSQYEIQKYTGLFTNAHKKLKELESKATQLESLSKLVEELEKQSALAWAEHAKENLSIEQQAVQFYNALLITSNSLRNSEKQIKELKTCNEEYIQQQSQVKRQAAAYKKETESLKKILADLESKTNTSSLKRNPQDVMHNAFNQNFSFPITFQDAKQPKKALSLLSNRSNV
ncbi:unnamed protein product [Blepharisma stoltei]|uniref:RING-type domain-containing protein n=1 Tax=Blepharisma stoltei TaxID=1481888 RepID=A0AAU9KS63_9CILI|nr:unnamed protein product [Blepharisma stoltei]